jgi:hypothetical protein
MKWWWTPWRKQEWLREEAAYKDARQDLMDAVFADPRTPAFGELTARCERLKPEGWTREIERRRWNVRHPRARRWTA